MRKIQFTKMVASGNDFTVIRLSPACPAGRGYPVIRLKKLARAICDRKFGIGADGLLVLGRSGKADLCMRVFNADGSEASMCGNGARCAALYFSRQSPSLNHWRAGIVHSVQQLTIDTKAGIIEAQVSGDNVKIKLTDPRDIRLDIPLKINGRLLKANFINTGVPHAVIFVQGLSGIDVANLGRQIRYHRNFAPAGTNVNFVELADKRSIKVRTYERGVEDETLACGTGSVASVLIFALKTGSGNKILVHTQGKEVLKVYFKRDAKFTPTPTAKKQKSNTQLVWGFRDVCLEGKARIVAKGEYYV